MSLAALSRPFNAPPCAATRPFLTLAGPRPILGDIYRLRPFQGE